jgi:two-component system cell cycle sensor histidine kinase/response regulator CckA
MFRLGLFSLIASALQLIVPSYGLRLLRLFGVQRVGWFLVMAFSSLALVHLFSAGLASASTLDVVYAVASVVLVIGMGHLETLFGERVQSEEKEQKLQSKWELCLQEKTRAIESLAVDNALHEQRVNALEESEAHYRFLFSENPQPMYIFDLRSLRFLAVNKAAQRQYGFTPQEFTGLKARDLLPPDAASSFMQDVAKPCSGVESRGVWRHRCKDGSLIDVEVTAVDLRFAECPARVLLARDISESRQREQQSRQAQKMETIGQLAGGAAHHFNNIMTIIDGHANLLLQKSYDLKTAEQLKLISAAANRASALTRQLLAVGGRHVMEKETLDLNAIVRNLNPMIRRLLGEFISLENHCGPELKPVEGDPHLIEHILINLVLNARDAMASGGRLMITTAPAWVDEAEAHRHPQARAGEFVCLAVRDTGCGISQEAQAHLFEPFFTTKDHGRATGLGLASVYGAVRQHEGWIEFTTEAGVGTEFKVYLPCTEPVPEPAPRAAAPTVAVAVAVASVPVRECVMLVEPDDRARGLARFVLNRHGYYVIEAADASTAVFLWEGQGRDVDLLLVDLSLSESLSGRALADQLRENKPNLKVLYTVGSVEGGNPEDASMAEDLQFILKPFSPDRLLQAVQNCFTV